MDVPHQMRQASSLMMTDDASSPQYLMSYTRSGKAAGTDGRTGCDLHCHK